MAKSLEELKQQVSLTEYAQQTYDIKKVGAGTYRIDPCPACGGNDHFTINEKGNYFKSFAECCKGGSIIDWFIQVEGMGQNEAIDKLYSLAGEERPNQVVEQKPFFKMDEKKTPSQPQLDAQPQPNISELDYTDYITKCYDAAFKKYPQQMGDFFLSRGISVNEIMEYKLSVFKDTDGLRAMLPVWYKGKVVYYVARALEGQKAKYKNPKGAANHFFNSHYLDEPQETPIFITEGIVDAISLERIGFKAIALNSVSNTSSFIELLRTKPKAQNTVFLTAFDNDEPGRKAAEAMPFKSINIPTEHKDVNDWLIDSVKKAQEGASDVLDIEVRLSTQIKTATQPDAVSDYLEHGFYSDIAKLLPYRNKKTGFDNLDNKMNGLQAGLYVVGGVSSVGKTTFVHQLVDQVAEMGDHVIYFSLEQSKLEMVSKSLSRMTAKIDLQNAMTSLTIRNAGSSPVLKDAMDRYKEQATRMNIVEGNFNTNVHTIREYISTYIKQNGVSPTIVVDYLQIMPAADLKMSDKQRTDFNVTELKRISRDFAIPVFVISSFNRMSYLTPVSFESFKESGGIEYTADVVWGLQLGVITSEEYEKAKEMTDKIILTNKAKAEEMRKIQLVCLKNRNGSLFTTHFSYHAKFDYYKPNEGLNGFRKTLKKVDEIPNDGTPFTLGLKETAADNSTDDDDLILVYESPKPKLKL